MNKSTNNANANIYISAAEQLGIKYQIINQKEGLVLFESDKKKVMILGGRLSENNIVSTMISKNKHLTTSLLMRVTDLIPNQYAVDRKDYNANKEGINKVIVDYTKLKNLRIVIKPVDLAMGNGVFVLPKSVEEVLSAVDFIFNKLNSDQILIEDYFEASQEYRVILYRGEILGIYLRIPAFVVGDGTKNLEELIKEKNEEREKHSLKQIKIDSLLTNFLSEQNMGLNTIPKKNIKVRLRKQCNLSQGGEVEKIDINLIHDNYRTLFRNIYEVTNLKFMGLDLMTLNNISEKPSKSTAMINEINSAPNPDVVYMGYLKEENPFKGIELILKTILDV